MFNATIFVVGKVHLEISLALCCACFALIYFAVARWAPLPLYNSLGLAHFTMATLWVCPHVCASAGPAMQSVASWAGLTGQAVWRWTIFELFAGLICFHLGWLVFGVNGAWTFIGMMRCANFPVALSRADG